MIGAGSSPRFDMAAIAALPIGRYATAASPACFSLAWRGRFRVIHFGRHAGFEVLRRGFKRRRRSRHMPGSDARSCLHRTVSVSPASFVATRDDVAEASPNASSTRHVNSSDDGDIFAITPISMPIFHDGVAHRCRFPRAFTAL